MIKAYSIIALLFCFISLPVFAAENLDRWRCTMPIQTEGTIKYKSVFLTEDVYEHAAASLADLRIIDGNGNYVPFYIKSGSATLQENQFIYAATVVQKFKEKNDSSIDFKINVRKANEDIVGNTLAFELPEGNFLKHLNLYGSNDGDQWEYIGKDYVFREESRLKNEVALGKNRKYTYYRVITLDNPEDITLDHMKLINHYTNTQWHDYTKTAPLQFTVETSKNESIVTLKNPQKLKIKQIRLTIDDNFQRNYHVYSEAASKTAIKKGELYNLQLENVKIAGKEIDFGYNPISTTEVIIKINNRDDRPLTINAISIEYYLDKLVFPDDGNAPYQLYFGNSSAEKPSYEIALQQKYIDGEMQERCIFGTIQTKDEEPVSPTSDVINTKYIFNGMIVAVSILLVGLLVTRLSKKNT